MVHLELQNSNIATCTSDQRIDVSIGDILLVDTENGSLELAPQELWPERDPWVGVVKLLPEGPSGTALVEVDGQFRILPLPGEPRLHVGNTVQGTDKVIERVLSDTPVRRLDLSADDAPTVNIFKNTLTREHGFEEFGGSPAIVARARELIEVPLDYHDELKEIGARPIKGVLFTGESGTGKTMLARIIASQAAAAFYQISGPEIMSKWLGQSEELIRKLFEDAGTKKRAIIFFDEIDSLATQRSDDSHEASRRIVGQLLTSMDGFSSDQNVVVIATTNRPQDVDVALRRPGRFDWEIHFPLPGREDREAILVSSAPKGAGDGLPHAMIADKTETWSSAELVAIWSEAALFAVTDKRMKILKEDYIGGYERVAAQRAQKKAERERAEKRLGRGAVQ